MDDEYPLDVIVDKIRHYLDLSGLLDSEGGARCGAGARPKGGRHHVAAVPGAGVPEGQCPDFPKPSGPGMDG